MSQNGFCSELICPDRWLQGKRWGGQQDSPAFFKSSGIVLQGSLLLLLPGVLQSQHKTSSCFHQRVQDSCPEGPIPPGSCYASAASSSSLDSQGSFPALSVHPEPSQVYIGSYNDGMDLQGSRKVESPLLWATWTPLLAPEANSTIVAVGLAGAGTGL